MPKPGTTTPQLNQTLSVQPNPPNPEREEGLLILEGSRALLNNARDGILGDASSLGTPPTYFRFDTRTISTNIIQASMTHIGKTVPLKHLYIETYRVL